MSIASIDKKLQMWVEKLHGIADELDCNRRTLNNSKITSVCTQLRTAENHISVLNLQLEEALEKADFKG